MQLGKEIKRLMELSKLTMEELGNAINASKGRISEWENGNNSPGLKTMHKLADYFGIPFEELNKLKELDSNVGSTADAEKQRPTVEKYDKFYKLTDVKELLVDKAMTNVTRRELAKLMAKVYDKSLETVLDELLQSDVLELDELRKRM